MPSQADKISGARRITTLSMLLAVALVLGAVERAIPFQPPVPGVRLGLPNLAILFAIYRLKFTDCITLTLMKCTLTAFIAGSFTSFVYSLCGSILSLVGMYLLLRTQGERIGTTGISVTGAVLHNIGQLLAASLIVGTALVMTYLPALLISAVITGVLTGTAAAALLRIPAGPTVP